MNATGSKDQLRQSWERPGWRKRNILLLAFSTCLVAALAVFVLPLYVPVRPLQTVSASYIAGFNNSVAILSAAGLSLLVLLSTMWAERRRQPPPIENPQDQRLSARFTAGVVVASAAVLSIAGWLVAASHMRYLGDAGYFIEQATIRAETGRALYTQLEFAYGPLLLLPQVWLSETLHCSMTAAYFAVFVCEAALGILLLAYVLNELPIQGRVRKAALLLFAFGAITPHLGLNYTLLRFVSPLAVLLFATRDGSLWRCALLLSVGELVELLISPELGLAMAVGVVVFGLLRIWQGGWRWLAAALFPLLVLGTFLLTFGRPYLRMAASFSRGALNLPVGPYPHILVYLFALVWLVPFGLGRLVRPGEPPSSRSLALYATSLAFVPAALGRCDPLHVLFNGMGVLVLSLVAVSWSSRRVQTAWLSCIALLVVWNGVVNELPFELRTAEVLRQTVMPHVPLPIRTALEGGLAHKRADLAGVLSQQPKPEFHLDMSALEGIVSSAPVATPLEISPAIEDELQQTHHYHPGFYAFWVDVMNPAAERRSITDVNECRWMLLPAAGLGPNPHTLASLAMFQGFKLPYRQRHVSPYSPGLLFKQNLQQNWLAMRAFGPYVLYKQKSIDAGQSF